MLAENSVMAQIPVHNMERARRFYTDTLGMKPGFEMSGGILMECHDGTSLGLYNTPNAAIPRHTIASWKVENLDDEMTDLRDRGVRFEEYSLPNLRTRDGVATSNGVRAAWFKDSEGNILCIAEYSE